MFRESLDTFTKKRKRFCKLQQYRSFYEKVTLYGMAVEAAVLQVREVVLVAGTASVLEGDAAPQLAIVREPSLHGVTRTSVDVQEANI